MEFKKIIITGGGSGGHLLPGIALAEKFITKNPKKNILFVGFNSEIEKKILKYKKYNSIFNLGVNYKNEKSKLRQILNIPASIISARKILFNFRPDVIISVGGHHAIPLCIAAKLKNIPFVICEQNIIIGKANQLLSIIADRVYTSFEKTIGIKNNKKAFFFGNPVRQEIININKIGYKTHKKFTILILGGSQGASSINTVIIRSLKHINGINKLRFIHQSGFKDEKKLIKAYKYMQINAEVKSFFNNIYKCYSKANMIICRAGATTLAEITAIGKYSLIIPYPYASRNHQQLNAEFLVKNNAATMILQKNLNSFSIAKVINKYIYNPDILFLKESNSKNIGKRNAAEKILINIYKMLDQKKCI